MITQGTGSYLQKTPPRAWGRLSPPIRPFMASRKHPHGRGEDWIRSGPVGFHPETPPRAWGRRPETAGGRLGGRNTPTGVGKTSTATKRNTRRRKHPHGRGEDARGESDSLRDIETPPRAWGRQIRPAPKGAFFRNTPTGVGKTISQKFNIRTDQKHPHGRGEDFRSSPVRRSGSETPPRAWGRLRQWKEIQPWL